MDSSSAVEEANYQKKPKNSVDKTTTLEECDEEAWETLNKGFKEAQTALDQNRLLIQQVNENHQSKIPDNLVKNVALIQEINGNISKIDCFKNANRSTSSKAMRRFIGDILDDDDVFFWRRRHFIKHLVVWLAFNLFSLYSTVLYKYYKHNLLYMLRKSDSNNVEILVQGLQ